MSSPTGPSCGIDVWSESTVDGGRRMSVELLKTRIEVLLRSVGEVEAVVRVLQENRDKVEQMSIAVSLASQKAESLVSPGEVTLDEVRSLQASLDPRRDAPSIQALKTTFDVLSKIQSTIPELVKALKGPVDDLRAIVQRAVMLDPTFVNGVSKNTRTLRNRIDGFLDELEDPDKTVREHWQKYFDEIVPDANRLFSDYMDLVAGVSIRERGVAINALAGPDSPVGQAVEPAEAAVSRLDQLCTIADWHVTNDLAVRVDWPSSPVTIPGRDGAAHLTSWPILRLGFASWSIWGMPLEGHEFGKLVASDRADELRAWKEETAAFGELGLRLLVADTIGAWTEGPAYACALLLLALDPRQGRDRPPAGVVTNTERARFVRTCLRSQIVADSKDRAPESADVGYGYLEFVDQVDKLWRSALPKADDDEAADRRSLLESLPRRVWRMLGLKRPFEVGDWRTAQNVWGLLAQDQPLPTDPPLGMRHLMNAAWYARCSPHVSPRPPVPEIERRTLRAGHAMAQQRGGGDPRPGGGRRR